MEQVAGWAVGMGALEAGELRCQRRQAIRDLAEKTAEEEVRAIEVRINGDGAEEGGSGVVEAAEAIVADAESELELRASRQAGRGLRQDIEGGGPILLLEQRLGGLE